jgi:hypothetical protein
MQELNPPITWEFLNPSKSLTPFLYDAVNTRTLKTNKQTIQVSDISYSTRNHYQTGSALRFVNPCNRCGVRIAEYLHCCMVQVTQYVYTLH